MSDRLNEEPTKAQIVLGSAAAGVLVLATVAVVIPFGLVAFIWNLPRAAFENWERWDTRRNRYYRP